MIAMNDFPFLFLLLLLNRLKSGHHYAERDIVQFVPFRDFKTVSFSFICSGDYDML